MTKYMVSSTLTFCCHMQSAHLDITNLIICRAKMSILLELFSAVLLTSTLVVSDGNHPQQWKALTLTGHEVLDECSLCSLSRSLNLGISLDSDCVITEDVLLNIMSLLHDAWRIITGTLSTRGPRAYSATNVDRNCSQMRFIAPNKVWLADTIDYTANSSPCEEAITDIEDLIVDITEQIRLLVAWLDDPENFNPRIAELEECLRCVNRKLDDTIAHYDQQLGNFTERFGEMQQCFTNSINEQKKEIQALQTKLEHKSYNLISSSVNASGFSTAITEFIKLNDNSILESLTIDLYGSEKLENLLTFAFLLPQPSQRSTVYRKVVSLMQQHGQSLTMLMLSVDKIFHDDVKRICKNSDIVECLKDHEEYRNTKMLIDLYTKLVKAAISDDICKNNYRAILRAGSPENVVNVAGNALNSVLPEIIKLVHERCPAMLNHTLDFVSNLRWNKQIPVGYAALLDVFTTTEQKLVIAFKMKESLLKFNGPDGNVEDAEDKMSNLRDQLPQPVKSLVWHSSCNLKTPVSQKANDYDNQFLIIDGGYGASNSRVLLASENKTTAQWKFTPVQRKNGDINFLVVNLNTDEYLSSHLPWRNWDEWNGRTAATSPVDNEYPPRDYNWEVRFDENSKIKLYHIGRKGFLRAYSNKEGNYLRTGIERGSGTAGLTWQLYCNDF